MLRPPHDPLDDLAEDESSGPQHWVQMHDVAGLYHFTMCERFSEAQCATPQQTDKANSDGHASSAPVSKGPPLASRRRIAQASAQWEWPWLGQAASCRDFIGLGYTLGVVEDVTAQVFCIPTEHFQHACQVEGMSPFAKRAKEQLRAKEARARRERRQQRLEQDKLKPIWQRGNSSTRSSEGLRDTTMTGFSALSVCSDTPGRSAARTQKDRSDAAPYGAAKQNRRATAARHTKAPKAARRVLIGVERVIVRGEGGGGEKTQVVL